MWLWYKVREERRKTGDWIQESGNLEEEQEHVGRVIVSTSTHPSTQEKDSILHSSFCETYATKIFTFLYNRLFRCLEKGTREGRYSRIRKEHGTFFSVSFCYFMRFYCTLLLSWFKKKTSCLSTLTELKILRKTSSRQSAEFSSWARLSDMVALSCWFHASYSVLLPFESLWEALRYMIYLADGILIG